MIRRSYIYLVRNFKRSVLLLLLMTVISISIVIGLCIWSNINTTIHSIQQKLGTGFNCRLPSFFFQDESYYIDVPSASGGSVKAYAGPTLNDIIVDNIMQVDGIATYNADNETFVSLDNLQLVYGLFKEVLEHPELYELNRPYAEEEIYTRTTKVFGNTDTELAEKFRTGAFTLSSGRHITPEDRNKVLISRELAELNRLEIGDYISINSQSGASDPSSLGLGESQQLEIVGIFQVNGYQPSGKWVGEFDNTYNWIMTDTETVKYMEIIQSKLEYEDYIPEPQYSNVTFFVDDPLELETVLDEVKHLTSFDTSPYDIAIDDSMYRSTVAPLNSIRNLVVGLVAVIVIGCVIVLCIVFTMWVSSRKHEIAIYLSLGYTKASIIGQFILEAAVVALIAGVLSFAVCQRAPEFIGNQMLTVAIENAQPQKTEYTREEIHQAAQNGTTNELFRFEVSSYAGPEHIDFTLRLTDFVILLMAELLIITGAICKGASFIFKMQPRQIMTELR